MNLNASSAKSFHESVDNMTKSASFPGDKDPRSLSRKLARAAEMISRPSVPHHDIKKKYDILKDQDDLLKDNYKDKMGNRSHAPILLILHTLEHLENNSLQLLMKIRSLLLDLVVSNSNSLCPNTMFSMFLIWPTILSLYICLHKI
ncbi:hypothetical protein CR513_00192, partial [Mucuna pruriens]